MAHNPVVQSRTTSVDGSFDTAKNVGLPVCEDAGDLMLAFMSLSGGSNSTTTWPCGWTEIFDSGNGTSIQLAIGYKESDGCEGDIVVTALNSCRSSHVVYRISGWDNGQAPEDGTSATGSGTSPNPGTVTPAGGSDDYLWIAACAVSVTDAITAPSGYSNIQQTSSAGNKIATAEKSSTASSEDAGVFTAGSGLWVAVTVAITPASAGGTPIGRTGLALRVMDRGFI